MQEKSMGTQSQTPNSQTQQPKRPGSADQDERQDRQAETQRTAKGKDAGNVPRSEDDVTEESDEGTREDAAGSNVRNK
jgi:hypothetical protein